jgi:nicotinamide riboside kinase
MGLLSTHESIVWREFQMGKNTSSIAEEHEAEEWSPAYVSRVLNRAREKIAKTLREHANSHRLDIETLLDYKGLLIGYDYQTSTQVYIVYTEKLGTVVWYKHDSYAGKLCPECPKEKECRETLDIIIEEYNISLRADEKKLHMTDQSIAIFNKLAAKETPRYKRQGGD